MRALRSAGSTFHAFVAGLLPVIVLATTHLQTAPLPLSALLRPMAVVVAVTAAMLLVLSFALRDRPRAAATVSLGWIIVAVYPSVRDLWQRYIAQTPEIWLAVGYTLVAAAIVCRLQGPLRQPLAGPLNAIAASLCIAVAVLVLAIQRPGAARPWDDAVYEIGRPVSEASIEAPQEPRDIYYLVLDGFAGPDVLEAKFGIDAAPFVQDLVSRGFSVPGRSRSNYSQTFLSLASSLNAAYLDQLAPIMHDSDNRLPLHALIQRSAVIRRLREAGYEFVMVGSDSVPTFGHRQADDCHCGLVRGPSEFEYALIHLSLLRVLPFHQWATEAHRNKVQESFQYLETATRRSGGPRFVFAHILVPHPPFVLSDTEVRRFEGSVFSLGDGNHFPGSRSEYAAGYREQVRWTMQRVIDLIDAVDRASDTRPFWLIHADHGSGLDLHQENVDLTDAEERLSILMAIRVGGAPGNPTKELTPVNAVRMLLNSAVSARLPILPSRSYLSSWPHPYRLVRVTSDARNESLDEPGQPKRSFGTMSSAPIADGPDVGDFMPFETDRNSGNTSSAPE